MRQILSCNKIASKYRPRTVDILNKKPKLVVPIENFK